MTLLELQKACILKLKTENAEFEARQMIIKAFGLTQTDWLIKRKSTADTDKSELCFDWCRRRNSGEPLYYILGECEFYGLPFDVGKGVLIPRADTEVLVETALELIKNKNAPKITDLCSGSGCVAIALAHCRPDARVTAVEKYKQAYSYLCANIKKNNAQNVTPLLSDALCYYEPADIIVCNPPYIDFKEKDSLQTEVKNEPDTALFSENNGYYHYQTIISNYSKLKNITLCFEVGYKMDSEVVKIMMQNGFKELHTVKDLCGVNRVVYGSK